MSDISFLVLGSGSLGSRISHFLGCKGYHSICKSFRSPDVVFNETNCCYDYIVDCMDLSHSNFPEYARLQASINAKRKSTLENTRFKKFIYISSSAVYLQSADIIDESSPIKDYARDDISIYLKNKLQNECHLRHILDERLHVFRPVSLWGYNLHDSKEGFFVDLLISRNENKILPLRSGDEKVISFMQYDDAASVIIYLLTSSNKPPPVCNITAWQWDSRLALKGCAVGNNSSVDIGWRVSSLYYNQADLKFSFMRLD